MHIIFASTGSVDFGQIFTSLAIILILAKVAAEISERLHVPVVLGEILMGIVIGPSALGLVDPSDAIKILAEIGVIILLAEVGLEMDLAELRKVGRVSILVAIIGVVVPMSSGILAGQALGESLNASLFLGSALAATSVGITARVFGDLRSLSSTEARIVLGAAVVDDIFGLVILTVVTRVVEQGSIDVAGLLGTIGIALGFLIVATSVGVAFIPKLITWINTRATSTATVGVVAAGITFAFSAAANSARLAPIIGAFVAGAALSRTKEHDRIARDFQIVGRIFIPIFFLQIGIDTDVTKFFDAHVLLLASILAIIAIAGKMAAAFGAFGTNSDKLLIGIGMVPRGEVGLIFASIGVSVGVFQEDLYAVVLLVVLLTTLVAPPALRWRIQKSEAVSQQEVLSTEQEPSTGWLSRNESEVELNGTPPDQLILFIALDAAQQVAEIQPGPHLLDWMHARRNVELVWNEQSTEKFVDLLQTCTARTWRFLDATNVVYRALPEIAEALETRRADASSLDSTHFTHLPILEYVRKKSVGIHSQDPALLIAAFISDFTTNGSNNAINVVSKLGLEESVKDSVVALVSASTLMFATSTVEPYEPNNRILAQLASYLGTPAKVEYCRLLTEARGGLSDWQYSTLMELSTSVQQLLAHPELIEGVHDSLESVRRRAAISLTQDSMVMERIEHAAAVYVLAHEPEDLVRHATLVEPAPRPRTARIQVTHEPTTDVWRIEIATRDMRGLLARICSVLAERGHEIVSADLATWPDGAVLDTFHVRSLQKPNAPQLVFDLEQKMRKRLTSPRKIDSTGPTQFHITLDNNAHPWHSVITVTGKDQPGFVQAIATALAKVNINVHHAQLNTIDGTIADRFEVSTRYGRKITESSISALMALLT